MRIRLAAPADLDDALAVYKSARAFMREAGNPNQWGDSFPPRELVEQDIASGALRVCVDENDEVLGPTGAVAIPEFNQGRGIGGTMLDWAIEHGRNLHADTHRDNKPMQGLLASRGFTYCGIIKLGRNGDERLAYVRCDPRP